MQVICSTPQEQGKCGVQHNNTVRQKDNDMSGYRKCDVYWWVGSESAELYRYGTEDQGDIESGLPNEGIRVRVWRQLRGREPEQLELILRRDGDRWLVHSPDFDPAHYEYPFVYASAADYELWTDAQDDELMVIQLYKKRSAERNQPNKAQ